MVHLSKHELSEKTLAEIKEQFVALVFAQASRAECRKLLYELLAPKEEVMLAKRVAAIGLLSEGYSTYQVAELLCMSPVTLGKLQTQIEDREAFNHVRKVLKRRGQRREFIRTVESLLTYGGASKLLRQQIKDDIERWKDGM